LTRKENFLQAAEAGVAIPAASRANPVRSAFVDRDGMCASPSIDPATSLCFVPQEADKAKVELREGRDSL
jgi:hypothetical protein